MPFGWKCALRTAKPIYAFFILSLRFAILKLQRKHPVISTCCRLQDAEKADIQKTGSIIRIDFPPPDTLVTHSLPLSGPTRPLFKQIISLQVMLVAFYWTRYHVTYTEFTLFRVIVTNCIFFYLWLALSGGLFMSESLRWSAETGVRTFSKQHQTFNSAYIKYSFSHNY